MVQGKTTKYLNITMSGSTGKTYRYEVRSKAGDYLLGTIKWFGRWRAYVFYPSYETVFDAKCLTDITQFMEELGVDRRQHPCESDALINESVIKVANLLMQSDRVVDIIRTADVEYFLGECSSQLRGGFAMSLRNSLLLWDEKSELHRAFAKMGITNPDDMSEHIIRNAYDIIKNEKNDK